MQYILSYVLLQLTLINYVLILAALIFKCKETTFSSIPVLSIPTFVTGYSLKNRIPNNIFIFCALLNCYNFSISTYSFPLIFDFALRLANELEIDVNRICAISPFSGTITEEEIYPFMYLFRKTVCPMWIIC